MITQGNILLAQGTSAQIETSARPNMFVHNTTDKSLVYSPDGVTKYRYDSRDKIASLISAAGYDQSLNTTDDVFFDSVGTNYIDFNTSVATVDYQLGRLHWSDDDKTLDLDLDNGSVLQIGQETLIRGQNSEVDTLINGTVVYIGGAQGNRPKMYRADADAVGKSKVIAIATQSIPANQTGFFTAFGLVRDINTNSWNEGDELFLSTSAGIMTNVKPSGVGIEVVSVGFVIRKSATVGSIFFTSNREANVNSVFGRIGDILTSAGDYNASQITNTAAGTITATNVQNALNELDNEKVPKTTTITAGTGLTGGGDLTTNRTLSLATTGTAGTYTKVTTNAYGQVTAGTNLTSADIPTLPSTKIGTGIISDTEFGYLNGTSADIQSQLTTLSASRLFATNGADNRIATFSNSNTLNGESGLTFDGTTFGVGLSANINSPTLTLRQNPGAQGGATIDLRAAGILNDENSGKIYLPGQRIIGMTNNTFKHQRYNSTTSAYETTFGIESGIDSNKDINFYGDLITISAANSRLVIDAPAGNAKGIRFNDSGTIRWYAGALQNNSFVIQDVTINDFPISAISGSTGAIVLGGTNNRKVNITSLNTSAVVVTDGSKNLVSSTITTTELGYLDNVTSNIQTQFSALSGTTSNIQTQIDGISQSITRNVISVASNTSITSTGRHLSATIPANTISQTVPTQVKVVGKIGANYVGGTATIEIEIAGNNIFTHTLTASGQNEDDIFEIDFGIRYAGSSTMECFGLCKIANIVTTTQTPKMRYVSSYFTGLPSSAYVFDVKSTITGEAGASITLVKVTNG